MTAPGSGEMAEAFEAQRPYLRRLAYATLGSSAEADDCVQEAWLRLQRVDPRDIHDLRAWLTTVVSRLALDALGSARRRRERYVGPWLPEPLVAHSGAAATPEGADPADRVTLHERVTTALLLVLERLSPAERTAFVLHDVFGLEFGEVADVVGRSPAAVRQLAARARRHVRTGTPRDPASREEHERIVRAFADAWQRGDIDALLVLLDPGVVARNDGGGRISAVRTPVEGVRRVLRMLAGMRAAVARRGVAPRVQVVDVNDLPGLVMDDGEALNVAAVTIDHGRIVAIDVVRNPDKLRGVPLPWAP